MHENLPAKLSNLFSMNQISDKQELSVWSGFYKKALKERQNLLRLVFPHIFLTSKPNRDQKCFNSCAAVNGQSSQHDEKHSRKELPNILPATKQSYGSFPLNGLENNIADNMIENCVGTMGLPVGLALNFVIDGHPVVIPMAIEEPSVIAAVSGAAKTICGASSVGFVTTSPERNVINAQLLLTDIAQSDLRAVIEKICENKAKIIDYSNQFCRSMKARGGGVVDVFVRQLPAGHLSDESREFLSATFNHVYKDSKRLVLHVVIDVCDAMGANCASTVAEGLSPLIAELISCRVAVRIVSNLNPQRLTTASFCINVKKLAYKNISGEQVAARILEAYHWACDDPFRATTHNKGVMNGIDAVALATGQDWRAVEAACHAWASSANTENSKYSSLTRYWIEKRETQTSNDSSTAWFLCGSLTLPLIVGTKGGVVSTSPLYTYTLGMMGFPDSKRLAAAMCCVGLCQNFAALRALTTEGIQRGHMHLHARNIALAAGAPTTVIPEVTLWMIEKAQINIASAREYITAHRLYTRIRNSLTSEKQNEQKSPSMFFFKDPRDPTQTLNIAFQTFGPEPVFLDFTDAEPKCPIHAALFGGKMYQWLAKMLRLLDKLRLPLINSGDLRTNENLCYRLKVLSLILNFLLRRLMIWCPKETRKFAEWIFEHTLRQRESGASPLSLPQNGVFHKGFETYSESGSQGSYQRPSISRYLMKITKRAASLRSNCGLPNQNSNGASTKTTATNSKNIAAKKLSTSSCSTIFSMSNRPEIKGIDIKKANSSESNSSNLDETEWELPESGIFKSEVFDIAFLQDSSENAQDSCPETWQSIADDNSTNKRIFELGFPLFVAVWQIFEVWVTQYVSTPCLAAAILKEQRIVVSSIIAIDADLCNDANLGAEKTSQTLESYFQNFDVLSKRPQCTLFLFIDSISLSPDIIQPPFLDCIAKVGLFLEQVASVAHDTYRIGRDYEAVFGVIDPTPNLVSISGTLPTNFRIIRNSIGTDKQKDNMVLHVEGVRNSLLSFAIYHYGKDKCQNLSPEDIDHVKNIYSETINLNNVREQVIIQVQKVCQEFDRPDIALSIGGSFISEVTKRINEEFLS